MDRMLGKIFDTYNIDPGHCSVGGFSDGASYALSLGLTNGDLFSHILAYSPGFSRPAGSVGKPKIFIMHGKFDEVLHIDHCSRRLGPRLKAEGYALTYKEFNGPHTVPEDLAVKALDWFLS